MEGNQVNNQEDWVNNPNPPQPVVASLPPSAASSAVLTGMSMPQTISPAPVTAAYATPYASPELVQASAPQAAPSPVTPSYSMTPGTVPEISGSSDATPQNPIASQDPSAVSWTASEYADNQKNISWFMLLAAVSVVAAAVAFFITKSIMSAFAIGMLGVILGIFGASKPKVLQYIISTSGIQIGEKMYSYSAFKSFSVSDEASVGVVTLSPLKRYMMPIVIHFDLQDEDRIMSLLASFLPVEEHKHDVIDRLSHKIRL